MTNSKTEYNEFIRANLPQGITYNTDTNRYVVNEKPWITFSQSEWYLEYISKFGFSASTPTQDLLNALLVDATQLIAHPLEYGSMFQDRAGTTPVTEPGQLVGHVLDAGGGGYHATAISDAARGVFREVDGIRYIEYNGVNTAYSTPAIAAPGVDKAQVFAGVRKLSDAAGGMVVEHSASTGDGRFYLLNFTDQKLYWLSRGGAVAEVSSSAISAPATRVVTTLGDISGDLATLRIDGTQVAQSTADQGAGNYNPAGTYPLYYGARAGTSLFFNGRHYDTLGPITRFSAANATTAQIEAAEAYYTARVI